MAATDSTGGRQTPAIADGLGLVAQDHSEVAAAANDGDVADHDRVDDLGIKAAIGAPAILAQGEMRAPDDRVAIAERRCKFGQ